MKNLLLKFTPLEFETLQPSLWFCELRLKFTPLEFETRPFFPSQLEILQLKFTPLEFETNHRIFFCLIFLD